MYFEIKRESKLKLKKKNWNKDGKVTALHNCRITFRNRMSKKQENKLPAIIEEAMEGSFDQLECENVVHAKRQKTKH